jgi:hypothetical protein
MVEYDVLGNERHKAVCKLREMPKLYPNKDGGADLYAWKSELADAIGADTELFSAIRDRLIHLLGGDQPTLSDILGEDDDGVDAGGCDEDGAGDTSAPSPQCDCGGRCVGLAEEVAPITTELREFMESYRPFEDAGHVVVSRIGTIGFEGFDRLCDSIDAVHAGLERDYKNACEVNEHQDLEYIDLAKRYDNTISLPLDADGVPIRIGDVMDFTKNVCNLTVLGIGIVDSTDSSSGVFVREGHDYVWYNAEFLRHHVPTVEDVLAKFALACEDADNAGLEVARIIAEYAAKLRLADS